MDGNGCANRRRILLVEDEIAHIEIIRRAFAAAALNIELLVVSTLQAARQQLADTNPDLVICDLRLPDGDGTQLLPPQAQSHSLFPIVILTALGDEATAVEAIKRGALDYVVKSRHSLHNLPQIAEHALREWAHIVARRRADQERQQQVSLNEQILENMLDGYLLNDIEGKLLDVNPAYCRLSGYSRHELLSMNIGQLDTSLTRDRIAAKFRSLTTQRSLKFETQHRCKEGRIVELDVNVTFLTRDNSALVASFVCDITKRKQAVSALQDSERRYRTLLDQNPEAIGVFSDGRMVYMNERLCQLCGYEVAELLDISPSDLLVAHDRARAARHMEQLLHGESSAPREYRIVRKDGAILTVEVYTMLIEHDERPALLSTFRDIGDRLRVEQETSHMREQLARVTRTIGMGEIAAALSHEINQPLAAIANYADACEQLLQANTDDTAQLRWALSKIQEQALRAGEIKQQMKVYSENAALNRESLDIERVIEEVQRLLQYKLQLEQTIVHVRVDKAYRSTLADRIQIQQVFVNLLQNAIQAMENITRSREIRIECKGASGYILVEVSDRGPGVRPEDTERIFEPYLTTKLSGMGMGLGISRRIVETHGGKLWCVSSPEGGRFCFTLPYAEPQSSADSWPAIQ